MILGTSETYRGDSFINVTGDLISCALGYNTARWMSLHGFPGLPLIVWAVSEFTLAMTIRHRLYIRTVLP